MPWGSSLQLSGLRFLTCPIYLIGYGDDQQEHLCRAWLGSTGQLGGDLTVREASRTRSSLHPDDIWTQCRCLDPTGTLAGATTQQLRVPWFLCTLTSWRNNPSPESMYACPLNDILPCDSLPARQLTPSHTLIFSLLQGSSAQSYLPTPFSWAKPFLCVLANVNLYHDLTPD